MAWDYTPGREQVTKIGDLPWPRILAMAAKSTYAPGENIGYLMGRAQSQMQNGFEKRIRHLGVTVRQWALLQQCNTHGAIPLRQLASLLAVDGSAVTRLLDRMEKAGLARRTVDETDRRVQTVELTAQARRLLPKLEPISRAGNAEALAGFSQKERRQLQDYLQRIIENTSGW